MNPERKKKALPTFTYSMYIASAADGDELAAGAVHWISQASFAPPLLMVSLRGESNLHRLAERTRMLAVNALTSEQKPIAAAFFKPSQVIEDRINGYAFERGSLSGAPILEDAWAWVEARVTEIVKRGDHSVIVAEVVAADIRDGDRRTLIMWDTERVYAG
jgi:flavin reductase (DIM6/NTAB) family NADH-FMN oxidoreductase RutF